MEDTGNKREGGRREGEISLLLWKSIMFFLYIRIFLYPGCIWERIEHYFINIHKNLLSLSSQAH